MGHADLLRAVWGPTYGEETQLLRVTMRNLRAKLGGASPGRACIATEYGLGYRFHAGALRARATVAAQPVCSNRAPSEPTSPARVPAKAAGPRSPPA